MTMFAGALVVTLVAWSWWGTAAVADRSQQELKAEFEKSLADTSVPSAAVPADPVVGDNTSSSDSPVVDEPVDSGARAHQRFESGEAIALLEIPAINLNEAIVQGTGTDELKKGPGHYVSTPMPGQPGNAAIAGHRTTFGAPFRDLDKLKKGDVINVTTRDGVFVYRVLSWEVLSPSDSWVIAPSPVNLLTLTTCHPEFSAAKRLVLTAKLVGEPVQSAPLPPVAESPEDFSDPDPSTISEVPALEPFLMDDLIAEQVTELPGGPDASAPVALAPPAVRVPVPLDPSDQPSPQSSASPVPAPRPGYKLAEEDGLVATAERPNIGTAAPLEQPVPEAESASPSADNASIGGNQ